MYYNFVRIHKTRKITPEIEAGVTDKLWNLVDVVKLLEEEALSLEGLTPYR
jgi:hypothetical protein